MISGRDIDEIPGVLEKAVELAEKGIKPKDAIHVSCAIMAQCDYFLTTDDALLRKALIVTEVKIVDPPSFIREVNP